jgi:hypothetical protein
MAALGDSEGLDELARPLGNMVTRSAPELETAALGALVASIQPSVEINR